MIRIDQRYLFSKQFTLTPLMLFLGEEIGASIRFNQRLFFLNLKCPFAEEYSTSAWRTGSRLLFCIRRVAICIHGSSSTNRISRHRLPCDVARRPSRADSNQIPKYQRTRATHPIRHYLDKHKQRDDGIFAAAYDGQHSLTAIAEEAGLSIASVSRIVKKMEARKSRAKRKT